MLHVFCRNKKRDSLNWSEADSKKPARILAAMEDFAKGILNETLERVSTAGDKNEKNLISLLN